MKKISNESLYLIIIAVLLIFCNVCHYKDPYFFKLYEGTEHMSKLTETQHIFAVRFSGLVVVASTMGYEVAFGDGYRDDRVTYGHPKSLHRMRLAHDLVLRKNGKVLGDEAHSKLHDVWKAMGGARRIEGDLNHYSWRWGNMR